MNTLDIEKALVAWFGAHFEPQTDGGKRVDIYFPGDRFEERTGLWIAPRIQSFERSGVSRRGVEHDVLVLEVACYAKVDPKGKRRFALSELVDETRRLVDSTERAGAQKIRNEANEPYAICDFGPAQERRLYGQSVTIGGIPIPGVDWALLTTRCQLSPFRPRVARP